MQFYIFYTRKQSENVNLRQGWPKSMNVFDPENGMGNGFTLEAGIYCYK